jgi:hypothetical protein
MVERIYISENDRSKFNNIEFAIKKLKDSGLFSGKSNSSIKIELMERGLSYYIWLNSEEKHLY